MLVILGDIHTSPRALHNAITSAIQFGATGVIQVGDFGVYDFALSNLIEVAKDSPIPIYFVDGNHEDFNIVKVWWEALEQSDTSVFAVVPDKLFYVRRGSVLELDDRRIGFLGGAASIDFSYSVLGVNWFHEEVIQDKDTTRLLKQTGDKPLDFLITHTPPQSIITRYFDTPKIRAINVRRQFGAPDDWFDPGAHRLEAVWQQLGRPQIFCGHMHRKVIDEQCTILGIDQIMRI